MRVEEPFIFEREFRLRGTVGGEERSFPLNVGANTLGREPANDVQILGEGVSQRHALLTIGPDGLRLEDLESKNGSFVNGSRIKTASLRPGDELWLGSAELVLDEIDQREGRLAIEIDPLSSPEPADALDRTVTRRRWLDARIVDRWLISIQEAIGRSRETLRPAPAELVGLLAFATGARGAAVLEARSDGSHVIVASCGEPDARLSEWLRSLLDSPPAPGDAASLARFSTISVGEGSAFTAAWRGDENGSALILALVGHFDGRTESEAFLAAHLRLLRFDSPGVAAPAAQVARATRSRLIFPPDYVVGVSPAIRELHAQMEPLARGDIPVLISGETGAGKEYAARILHASSPRSLGPFIAINCAAVPAELLEADLFGIGAGVATGVSAREGRFLKARGGTLLLDEIGELPSPLQPKLLRVLEDREIHPVGRPPVPIEARLIAATNSRLSDRIEEGDFRSDLFYRLAGTELRIPPLRQRREDIPMLLEHFVRRFSRESGKALRGITMRAMTRLTEYPWPGNVRELAHEARRLAYVCRDGSAVETDLLAPHIREGRSARADKAESRLDEGAAVATPDVSDWMKQSETLNLRSIECRALEEALRRTGGNQVRAGALLGISRMAVKRRIERCKELRPADPRGGDGPAA